MKYKRKFYCYRLYFYIIIYSLCVGFFTACYKDYSLYESLLISGSLGISSPLYIPYSYIVPILYAINDENIESFPKIYCKVPNFKSKMTSISTFLRNG